MGDPASEIALARLFAGAWFVGLAWCAWVMIGQRGALSGKSLLTMCMLGCSCVFLFWVLAAGTPLSIDHIRPHGFALGLWGFGFGVFCLIALSALD